MVTHADAVQGMKDTQAMISSQFDDYRHLPYRLYAVFIHRGTVEFGHYYIYIYDLKKEVWRKYNDSEISEVRDPDEIFRDYGSVNPPTPYFLVYVNSRMSDELVEPVCRNFEEPPQEDTAMDVDSAAPGTEADNKDMAQG